MLATTFHNALAINIFLAIVSAPEFLDTLLTITKDHPCMVQEQ
jgi:hypothetical protein